MGSTLSGESGERGGSGEKAESGHRKTRGMGVDAICLEGMASMARMGPAKFTGGSGHGDLMI
jgi:hypothetical protein